ncbi:mitochondrial ribosomal protein S18A [Brevipalpus obovatus]|uniref:mitochondrial ribosomal protein S18A n=1 Tax=Brevipalpus obovatus TaxID=246614 RepID=UPI003D9F7BC3
MFHILPSIALATRPLTTTSVRLLRRVNVIEGPKETIIKGESLESDRKNFLLPEDSHNKACPLCRLNLKRLKYTDVLILEQFLDSDGNVLNFKKSNLCGSKYTLVKKLIQQAQRCRLLPRPIGYPVYPGWDNYNTYVEFPKRYRDQPYHIIQKNFWRNK